MEPGLLAEAINLGSALRLMVEKYKRLGMTPVPPIDDRIVQEGGEIVERNTIGWNVREYGRVCKRLSLSASTLQSLDLETWIRHTPGITFVELATKAETLLATIRDECFFRYCVLLPPDMGADIGNQHPFGEAVWSAFPSSREDVRESVLCLALGRHSAAVYHAMCALEPAMKALARSVKAPWDPNRSTWGMALAGIEKQIRSLSSAPAKSRNAGRLTFLSQLAAEFRYFKDGWRNNVMHARLKMAEREEAERVIDHVRGFMTLASSRLHEERRSQAARRA